jgi:hypothetical protein
VGGAVVTTFPRAPAWHDGLGGSPEVERKAALAFHRGAARFPRKVAKPLVGVARTMLSWVTPSTTQHHTSAERKALMIFSDVYPEKDARRVETQRWVAVWRTPVGFTHDTLSLRVWETSREDARTWAVAHPPLGATR